MYCTKVYATIPTMTLFDWSKVSRWRTLLLVLQEYRDVSQNFNQLSYFYRKEKHVKLFKKY